MKNRLLFVFALGLLMLNTAMAQQGTTITYEQMQELRKATPGVLLDVRSDWEYTEGHLPCAQNIDISQPDFASRLSQLDKNQTYYVYCFSGGRSANAFGQMKKMGFKNVYQLPEGVSGFKKKGVGLKAGKTAC